MSFIAFNEICFIYSHFIVENWIVLLVNIRFFKQSSSDNQKMISNLNINDCEWTIITMIICFTMVIGLEHRQQKRQNDHVAFLDLLLSAGGMVDPSCFHYFSSVKGNRSLQSLTNIRSNSWRLAGSLWQLLQQLTCCYFNHFGVISTIRWFTQPTNIHIQISEWIVWVGVVSSWRRCTSLI